MNLDDAIKLARRLWPHDFIAANVGWIESASQFLCTVDVAQGKRIESGNSVSGACTAMVHRLREIEASRGRPS